MDATLSQFKILQSSSLSSSSIIIIIIIIIAFFLASFYVLCEFSESANKEQGTQQPRRMIS